MRYLHTMLRVRNLDAAMKFYQDALGLKEVRRIDNDKGRFTLVFLCAPEDEGLFKAAPQNRGAPLVELTYNWDEEKYGEDRYFGHLAYEVDDIYATCDRLMKRHHHQPAAARRQHGLRPLAGSAFDRAVAEGRSEAAGGAVDLDAEHRPLVGLVHVPIRHAVKANGGSRAAARPATSTPRCARPSTTTATRCSRSDCRSPKFRNIKRSFASASFPRRNLPRPRVFSSQEFEEENGKRTSASGCWACRSR